MPELTAERFEQILDSLCRTLETEARRRGPIDSASAFEKRVREVLCDLLSPYRVEVDLDPHPYVFPDIVLGKFGIECSRPRPISVTCLRHISVIQSAAVHDSAA